tara:strand:+ start:317 stop:562 length:246 start_codon:yes stop_codon:yes gene_type:complete
MMSLLRAKDVLGIPNTAPALRKDMFSINSLSAIHFSNGDSSSIASANSSLRRNVVSKDTDGSPAAGAVSINASISVIGRVG